MKLKRGLLLLVALLVLAGCSEYKKEMEKGEAAIQDEDYYEAIEHYSKASDLKPKEEEAKSYLFQSEHMSEGLSHLNYGDFDDALSSFEKVLEKDEYLILEEEANKQIELIEELKSLVEAIEDTQEKAGEMYENAQYEDALNVIENTLSRDLSHNSIQEEKEDLESLKDSIESDQSKKDKVQETLDSIYTYLDNNNYRKAKKLVENHNLSEYMTQEEGQEFAALAQRIESQIPSLSAEDIISGDYNGSLVKMGGQIVDVYDVRELEGFRLDIFKDALNPKEGQWEGYDGQIDVLFDDDFDIEELEGISNRDHVYFYGEVRGEVDMTGRYGQEYTTGVVTLEEVIKVVFD